MLEKKSAGAGRDLRMRADGFVEILLLCRALRAHQEEVTGLKELNKSGYSRSSYVLP